MLLQRTWVQFLAPTWLLDVVSKHSYRGLNSLFGLYGNHPYQQYIQSNTHTQQIKINILKNRTHWFASVIPALGRRNRWLPEICYAASQAKLVNSICSRRSLPQRNKVEYCAFPLALSRLNKALIVCHSCSSA